MANSRNAPCPCGSGEKYKRCCEVAQSSIMSPGLLILGILILVGSVIVISTMMNAPDQSDPQRVWSEEHGHWHSVNQGSEQAPQAGTLKPPPGPAPSGKVWSAEHGHWHDAG